MTDTLSSWLTTDAPASRRQAVLGNAYRGIVAILRNPTALIGLVIVGATAVIVMNIVVDILYAYIDPRVRVTK
jgi:ABC-type dipeptide/oligopeptide/nickel transport system permease component